MKPGTPCLIEPPAGVNDTEARDQLRGLPVTAVNERFPGFWAVLPKPVVVYSTCTRDPFGKINPPGPTPIAGVPLSWLRPLRGDPTPTESEPAAERVLEGVPLQ